MSFTVKPELIRKDGSVGVFNLILKNGFPVPSDCNGCGLAWLSLTRMLDVSCGKVRPATKRGGGVGVDDVHLTVTMNPGVDVANVGERTSNCGVNLLALLRQMQTEEL